MLHKKGEIEAYNERLLLEIINSIQIYVTPTIDKNFTIPRPNVIHYNEDTHAFEHVAV